MRAADLHRLARTTREIALLATGNDGNDRVNAGELAILEAVARHPESTISQLTRGTGLAQSLVSRTVRAMAELGAVQIHPDPDDRRKVRISLHADTRTQILDRADRPVGPAIAAATPALSVADRAALEHHLAEAEQLLRRATAAD